MQNLKYAFIDHDFVFLQIEKHHGNCAYTDKFPSVNRLVLDAELTFLGAHVLDGRDLDVFRMPPPDQYTEEVHE